MASRHRWCNAVNMVLAQVGNARANVCTDTPHDPHTDPAHRVGLPAWDRQVTADATGLAQDGVSLLRGHSRHNTVSLYHLREQQPWINHSRALLPHRMLECTHEIPKRRMGELTV